jgi:hypothetical protein
VSILVPPGIPARIWLVSRPGELHYIHKEPLEGITAWMKGVDATVVEYQFVAVVHTPPPKKAKP